MSGQQGGVQTEGPVMFLTATAEPFKYPQPVPWNNLPASAGLLPSWEQKKLELDMANLNTAEDTGYSEVHTPTSERGNPASTLQGSPSSVGSSSRVNVGKGSSVASGSHASTPLAQDRNDPFSSSSSTPATATSSPAKRQKKQNPLLRFLKSRFSSKNKNKNRVVERGRPPSSYGKPNATGGIGSQPYASKRKTRSGGFVEKLRAASGKAATKMYGEKATWYKINSKTPKDKVPQTWDEWLKAYSRGQLDVNDLPDPPQVAPKAEGEPGEPTPLDTGFLPGPYPDDQKVRQLAFNRLDWRGTRGPKASTIPVAEGDDALPDTLEEHPAFRNIVAQAREAFDSAISLITVFNEDKQLFLAETGVNGLVEDVPREVAFCSHACLTKPLSPFTIKNTEEDWRFKNNPMHTQFGLKSYYGIPLLAPDFSGQESQIPIGTLCIIDTKPRDGFTTEEKAKLGDLALLAQNTIANWSRARLNHRLNIMEKSFQAWKNDSLTLASLQADGVKQAVVRAASNPAVVRAAANSGGRGPANSKITDGEEKGGATGLLHISQPLPLGPPSDYTGKEATAAEESQPPSSPTTSAPVTTGAKSSRQKIYDISTRLVATSLDLDLVYILKLDFVEDKTTEVSSLELVSAYGLTSSEPAFDPTLHLKALRSEEGGLLYQNPDMDDLVEGERFTKNEKDVEYASALLVPIAESDTEGYVLAGFTADPTHVFERDDLLYMSTLASEIAVYLE